MFYCVCLVAMQFVMQRLLLCCCLSVFLKIWMLLFKQTLVVTCFFPAVISTGQLWDPLEKISEAAKTWVGLEAKMWVNVSSPSKSIANGSGLSCSKTASKTPAFLRHKHRKADRNSDLWHGKAYTLLPDVNDSEAEDAESWPIRSNN